MAATSYGVNAAEAVKLWSQKLYREALRATRVFPFIGSDTNSIIQIKDETSKGPGDRITTILRMQLEDDGIEGDETLEGNEEALSTFTQNTVINQLRHAVRSGGRMTEQRIPFSIRSEAEQGLRDWWANRIDTVMANQLAGNVAQTDTKFTGHQAATNADSDHLIVANGGQADNLSSANTFTLELVDKAVQRAEILSNEDYTNSVPVRPIKMNGEDYYVMFLHPYQVYNLRTATATGQWQDIQKSAIQGGQVTNSPIFTGALGVHNRCILHSWSRLPLAINNAGTAAVASTRRAVLCGAQAAVLAFGRENGPTAMTWAEELFDYQNQLGVSAGMIWGANKTRFNSRDFGVISVDTYAVAQT